MQNYNRKFLNIKNNLLKKSRKIKEHSKTSKNVTFDLVESVIAFHQFITG